MYTANVVWKVIVCFCAIARGIFKRVKSCLAVSIHVPAFAGNNSGCVEQVFIKQVKGLVILLATGSLRRF